MIKIPKTPWENEPVEVIAVRLPLRNRIQFKRILGYSEGTARRYAYLVLHENYLKECSTEKYRRQASAKGHSGRKSKGRGVSE